MYKYSTCTMLQYIYKIQLLLKHFVANNIKHLFIQYTIRYIGYDMPMKLYGTIYIIPHSLYKCITSFSIKSASFRENHPIVLFVHILSEYIN